MLNKVVQLVRPKDFSIKYEPIQAIEKNTVIVKPKYMAICNADQRYYQGKRDASVLAKKLPMALIHEATGEVVYDATGKYSPGQQVVLIPNQPPAESDATFFENYMLGTQFRSSGINGFMQELVALPIDRVVAYKDIPEQIATLSEFISVAMHGIERFHRASHPIKERIVVVGDGSLSYVLCVTLRHLFPTMHITVIGRNIEKLRYFSFVNQTYLTHEVPETARFHHAFECAGGQGSEPAINSVIDYLLPQGTIVLLGVSENRVAINTRDILEKGLTLIGSSRSGRIDFERTVAMLENSTVQNQLAHLIDDVGAVQSIEDLHRVFATDLTTTFKTVFQWHM